MEKDELTLLMKHLKENKKAIMKERECLLPEEAVYYGYFLNGKVRANEIINYLKWNKNAR